MNILIIQYLINTVVVEDSILKIDFFRAKYSYLEVFRGIESKEPFIEDST